ncbi:MAG: hypothetical protein QG566_559 [Patescibacteria group bacterium]|nr:hypothetical protein [Patescibacteria group bacterium]
MKTKYFFVLATLFLISCSKTSINEEVPTPTKVYKVGDTCLGGVVYKMIDDDHGFVVMNTKKSNSWDSAKSKETSTWKLPTCTQMDTIFSIQNRLKISFGIAGIYWTDGIKGNKYQTIYEKGHAGGPCYGIPVSNKINIVYVRQF